MKTPPVGPRRPGIGTNPRAIVLGSLTIEGHPSQVSAARDFVASTLGASHLKVDSDAATLLTSEIVTNAILHTKSGVAGGTVTIVVIGISRGVLVEVIDDGSAGVPIVKGDLYAAEGHGLFLVQQLADQWGYLRDPAGTTVWFHLPNPEGSDGTERSNDPRTERERDLAERYHPRSDVHDALITGDPYSRPARFSVAAM
jgi:anti-sigma regulatory factor (Ser/Thr protein kinase)